MCVGGAGLPCLTTRASRVAGSKSEPTTATIKTKIMWSIPLSDRPAHITHKATESRRISSPQMHVRKPPEPPNGIPRVVVSQVLTGDALFIGWRLGPRCTSRGLDLRQHFRRGMATGLDLRRYLRRRLASGLDLRQHFRRGLRVNRRIRSAPPEWTQEPNSYQA